MSLNPIAYTERVVTDFLRYQLTAYPLSDSDLHAQMRALLSLEESRRSPLLRGPYVSLSRPFREGATIASLVQEGVLHPALTPLVDFPGLYGHQEHAIREIVAGRTTILSTGTGSGKTEAFLYPIISRCLQLRDEGAPAGIVAVLVYPMNALAEDQLDRLRGLLAGSGITFGLYVGFTPEEDGGVVGERLPRGSSREDYRAALRIAREGGREHAIHPPEERVSRVQMRTGGEQPRILLTNVKQLELLLTRQRDVELFAGAHLDYLVLDEAHTYGGAAGAETAVLVRRLRTFCGRAPEQTVCVATSATIADPERAPAAGRDFAARFFGVPAESVAVVGEEHAPEDWPEHRRSLLAFPSNPGAILHQVLEALDAGPRVGESVATVVARITGDHIASDQWETELYDRLAEQEVVFLISERLRRPRLLGDLLQELERELGRSVPEEEVLIWLTLGAAAQRDGRPLLRPVVHAFVRGVGGAVVSFPVGRSGPRLHLSREEAAGATERGLHYFGVLTCRTCGQHYFETHVKDWHFTGTVPEGGDAVEDRVVWPALALEHGGQRAVLIDHLVGDEEDDEDTDGSGTPPHPATASVHMCRVCGALHPARRDRCDACGESGELVSLLAVRVRQDEPGQLGRCLACGARGRRFGGRFWEPARPVRAVDVADVHVLAQSMLHHAERRRLLVFADNRQEAAFQAGWMQDHARRFRLRALMRTELLLRRLSVGDLVARLDALLESDDDLSRALIPEVWNVQRREVAGTVHQEERRRFLRIQVLRELTTAAKQRVGLEPWGRIRVDYHGLHEGLPTVERWAERLGISPRSLCEGIGALLDQLRRRMLVLDRENEIFSRSWSNGDREVQYGYIPLLRGVPQGLKRERAASDETSRLVFWTSARGSIRQIVSSWGADDHAVDELSADLWLLLTDELHLLVPVTMRWNSGRVIANTTGAYQLDADRFLIVPQAGWWECQRCRRRQARATPRDICLAWRCGGQLERRDQDPDDFDLVALNEDFTMVRPREHSAQVPAQERDRIERLFKGDGDAVNTLVATPTLELGVDIGSLDTVLMRNVPPLPSNYWQRAGRAGRRHRMAVSVTHARPVSHDRAYFAEPLKLLGGTVEPPRFNLSNGEMIAKHVHAAVLTRLHQLSRAPGLAEDERANLTATLDAMLPRRVRGYLWDERGELRHSEFDVTPLRHVIERYRDELVRSATATFGQGWPREDAAVTEPERLAQLVDETPDALARVMATLRRRVSWAMAQIERLNAVRHRRGTLEPQEEAFFHRCDRLLRRLRGQDRRQRAEAEGYDDAETFGMLAAEGFLPGYGLETGAIIGTLDFPAHIPGPRSVDLRRPVGMALREYVPGVLVYANGHRFTPRLYRLDPEQEALQLAVDVGRRAITEVHGGLAGIGTQVVRAVAMSDVFMPSFSNISDEEDHRFQMSVAVYGQELERDEGGTAYAWGGAEVRSRRGVHLRLANIGPASRVRDGHLGYPLCTVCGQSRSPFASQAERDRFAADHADRCGQPPDATAFYAEVVVDVLMLPGCTDATEAHSLTEALRMGASRVLEMDPEDLHVLVLGRADSDAVDAYLYDPMPGGSGLIELACQRWSGVVAAAQEVLDCPSSCEVSCIDCLQTFRNAFYHQWLDRHVASQVIGQRGTALTDARPLPPRTPARPADAAQLPANQSEAEYQAMVANIGLARPVAQYHIELGVGWGYTVPDFFWELHDQDFPGVCVFIDGLSEEAHGNPQQAARDRQKREILRQRGYEVLDVVASDLTDQNAMRRHFRRLARALGAVDADVALRSPRSWLPTKPAVPAQAEAAEGALGLLVDAVRPLVRAVVDSGLPPPIVGYEPDGVDPDQGWQVEAAWPDLRVAVLVDADPAREAWLVEHGWTARLAAEWTSAELVAALRAKG